MNQRPSKEEYNEFQWTYVKLVPPEGEMRVMLREQTQAMLELFNGLTEEQERTATPPANGVLRK